MRRDFLTKDTELAENSPFFNRSPIATSSKETLTHLEEWMEDFIRTVRFVYAKNPQQLEALGIVVPS